MLTDQFTRREFSTRLASLLAFPSVARSGFGTNASPIGDELSHTAESIHQEVTFNANRRRVYQALTDPKHFTAMTMFSQVPKAAPARIAHEVGGAFTLFDGHITGRHVELVPEQRIVQAWRAADWEPGLYSIARFQIKDQGSKTTIVFDHTGFPTGQGQHLASGWHANYWEPLKKYLA